MKSRFLLPVVGGVALSLVLSGCGGGVRKPGSPPSDPEKAVEWTGNLWTECYEQGKVDTFYYSLPKSWRADIEKVVATGAGKMDKELWNEVTGLCGELAPVVRAQKDNLLELAQGKKELSEVNEDDIKLLADFLGAVPSMLKLSSLKKGDLDCLLGNGTFQKLAARAAAWANKTNLKITVVKSDDTTLTFKFKVYSSWREEWSSEKKELEFEKVDGVWVPEKWANKWDDISERLAEAVEEFEGEIEEEEKEAILKAIKVIRKGLPKIKKAKDSDDLMEAVQELGEKVEEALDD